MSMRERTTRKWVTRFVAGISAVVALFVLIFSIIAPNESNRVYGLSKEVSTLEELLTALSSSEYDEIVLTNAITLTNGTTLDGDLDDNGSRKIIRASVTGTTDQGVINSNASNYSLFYVASGATVHINNCIIKGGGNSAIVNGASNSSTSNNSTLYIDKCQISNSGSEDIHGGGIRNTVGSKIVLTNSSLTRNVAEYGAGFQNQQGTFIIDNCSISENRSLSYGGGGGENTGNNGRNEDNAYMYIYNSTIANNTSKEIGGGINNCKKANLYIINSTIAGNATTNGSESGAGVGNNDATLSCVNSILLDNVYLSDNTEVEQDAYSYSTGSVTLDGCVYGAVTGKTQALANAIDVEDTCYKVNDSDSVFAATKTGSLINDNGSQGTITYNQVALVEDEFGVTYAPLSSDSMALIGNSSITPVKVEFDYSDLSNITYHTGNECQSSTVAPTTIGGGSALSANEKVVTVTVFVNEDFIIDGGTIYGDSYIVNTNETSNITLEATSRTGDESVSVAWALVDQENETLEIVSGNNPYTIDTSLNSVVMQHSWDSSKNSYDIVLQPITLSLAATAGDSQVTLNWSLNWNNTFCKNYSISNSDAGFDIYYSIVNDFNSPATTKYGSVDGETTQAIVTGLENETTYYFFVVPKGEEETIDDEIVGYVAATPIGNTKTYGLATSLEAGEKYLIVSANSVGSAKALTSGSNAGSFTNVTISESSGGFTYIKTSAEATMLWTATKNYNNWRLQSGTRYVSLSRDDRILYTRSANMTVTFNEDGSATIHGNNRYLSLDGTAPDRSTTATYVYFFKEKTTKAAPTTVTASMQSILGEDSGTISGVSTLMEYSTDGVNWTSCTGTEMTNVPVGKYFFRYKETSLTFASKAVTVEVLPKKITNFVIKTSPTLNYTAKDLLDLSGMVVTIIYNDNTTIDVPFSSFASLDSSVYQRESGIITVSLENGTVLGCSDNGQKITVSLGEFSTTTLALNISHKYVNVAAKAATCEESGNYEYYLCDDCSKVFDSNKNETTLEALTILPTGHSYGVATYEWASDNSTCTATVVCQNDSNHVIRETVTSTSEITTNPTCTEAGVKTYTATFTDTTYFVAQSKTESILALGHDYDYSNGEWTWHNNYYVTVVFTCTHDSSHTVTYTATMSNGITKEATCEEAGVHTYTATVTIDGVDYTDIHEEAIAPIGHSYGYPTYVWASDNSTCTATVVCQNDANHVITETVSTTSEITTNPTCTNTGVKTYTATFTNGTYFTTQTKTEVVSALGHDYDYQNGVWNWDSVYYVTITFTCKNDSTHTTTKQATVENEVTKAATCEEAGIRLYTASITIDGVTYTDTYEEEIAPIGHSYGTPTFVWSSDNKTCTATVVCSHDSTHIITETVNSVSDVDKEPTCLEDGRGLFTATFTNTTYFYTQVVYSVIPALGHDYEVSYVWDGYDSVTATAVCKHDNTHVVTETKNATSVTVNPTCTLDGSITYTVVFENDLFEAQELIVTLTKLGHTEAEAVIENEVAATCTTAGSYDSVIYCTVCGEELDRVHHEIEAFGHTYGDITYIWSSDNLTVTATRSCDICGYDDEEIVVTTSVIVNPTCTATGKITYTAVFTNPDFETQTKKVEIPSLGHTEGEAVEENRIDATCTTDGSYDTVVYCTVCGEELDRVHHEIEAFGHTYGDITYIWSSDNKTVTATRSCSICGYDDEEIVVTTSVTVNPTCTATGKITYTAVFTNPDFETQTKEVEIPSLGHTEGEAVEENRIDATCTTAGSYDTVVYCTVCGEELDRLHHTIDALGHTEAEAVIENEVAATCTTAGSYDSVIYCTVCGEELDRLHHTIDALGHAEAEAVIENEVAATCTTAGSYDSVIYCTVCGEELDRVHHTIDALGHTPSDAVEENRIEATCTTAGSYDTVVYCTVCGEETSREHHTIPALGHAYGEVTYTWNSDNSKVTATRVCSVCGDIDTETVDTTSVTVNPTCTLKGKTTYTAVFTNAAFETQTEEVEIPSLGHTNGEAVIENEVAATCTTAGSYDTVVYCTVCGEELSRITTTIPALGHTDGEAVEENRIDATCETAGSYDTVVYCSVCDGEISREHHTIPALGHVYGEVTYIWSSDNSKVTATRICNHDHNHIETETVATTSVTVNPTCTVAGKVTYTVSFTNLAFEDQTKVVDIPSLGHIEALAVEENRIDATCTTDGSYDTVVYCTVCGEELSREHHEIEALGHTHAAEVTENEVAATCTEAGSYDTVVYCTVCGEELDRVHHTIDALGHTPLDAVEENRIDATCETAGSYDTVVYCSVCDGEISREHHTIPALGHAYGEVTYIWNSENSEVTATRVCAHDNNHVETETVTTSYKITTNPTCTETGIRTYTAVFTNPAFATQTKNETVAALGHKGGNSVFENEVDATCTTDGSYDVVVYCSVCGEELSRDTITVDALGHTFGEVTYTWSSDNSSVTATRVCSVCGDIETETVATTSVTTNPTCLLAGKTTYTATFTNPVFVVQTKEIEIPALGHEYGSVTYIWNSDNSKVTATRVCAHDATHIEAETVSTTSVTVNPTCTFAGKITYTATFTNPAFEVQTKEEEIFALGHSYGDATYTWSDDYSSVTATRVCSICADEDTETVATTSVTVNATCTTAGTITYTAEFTNPVFDAQTTQVTIPALGHEYGVASYTWSSDNTTVTARVVCSHDSTHVITESVKTTSQVLTEATCETSGVKKYTAVFTSTYFEAQTKEVEIPALGHNFTHYELVPTSCTLSGMEEYYYCENCNKYFDKNYNETTLDALVIEALGHSYDYANGTWTWSNDYKNATYKVTCLNNSAHTLSFNATITDEITLNPACTATGIRTYTAIVTVEGNTYTSTREVSIPALGHEFDYSVGEWTWSIDYTSATISFACTNDNSHKDTYNATISSSITVNPTCTAKGVKTYTAKVTLNGVVYTDTKTKEIDMVPHTYSHVDSIDATCEDSGIHEHYLCTACGEYFDSEYNLVSYDSLIIPALGHNYDYANGTWIWAVDYSNATYYVSCTNDNAHTLSYTATITSKTIALATHTETGKLELTATVEVNGVTYTNIAYEDTPRLHHTVSTKVLAKEPTCEANGNILYYYCEDCNTYYSDPAMENEISYSDTIIPALGHAYVHHDKVDATCTTPGMNDYYTCENCDKVFDSNKNETTLTDLVIKALGHTEGSPVEENRVNPTCEAAGSYDLVIYCTVCGEELSREPQVIPALGHAYVHHDKVDATCTTLGMNEYYTCENCDKVFDSNKNETILTDLVINALGHTHATPVEENVVNPTCTATGSYDSVIYCTVCGEELSREPHTIDALGHTEGSPVEENRVNPTCEATGSYDLVIYCTVCGEELSREPQVIPALGHTYIHHDKVDATCTTAGMNEYYTCENCDKVFDSNKNETTLAGLVINALGHTHATPVEENRIDATCEVAGSYDLVTYCTVCGEELSREPHAIPALGHTYGLTTYSWNLDHTACTAERTCLVCGSIDSEVATITTIVINATCISNGSIKYTATFTNPEFATQTYTGVINALGHDYQITYTWSNDNKTLTATAVCTHDSNHRITETVATTSITVAATCEANGSITYTALFTDDTFETQTKVLELQALGHTLGTPVEENVVNPTCTETGSYDLVTYCTVCGEELHRETIEVKAEGHIEGTPVEENRIEATCEMSGSYDLVIYCTICGEELFRETKTIDALGHTYIHHDANAATCTHSGNYEYYTCEDCHMVFDSDKNVTTLADLVIASLGHRDGTPVEENRIDATCEDAGSYDLVIYCTVCHEELSRESKTIEALGHTYGDITYTWSIDNLSVTATRICTICGHEEEETVATTSITASSTCEASGSILYTAEFEYNAFETQTKEVIIPALGHSYKSTVVSPTCEDKGYTIHICERCNDTYIDNYRDALGHDYNSYSWTWDDDYLAATITFTCSHDNNHKEVISINSTSVTVNPTCEATGSITYTVTIEFEGNTYKDTKVVSLDALEHGDGTPVEENRIDATCEATGSYDLVIYCSECGEELDREHHEIPALGHDYDYQNGVWDWASDHLTCCYIVTCKHDNNHTYTYTVTSTGEVLLEPTHEANGTIEYHASVTILDNTYETSIEVVLPKLHHETSITVAEKEATCDEDGNIRYYHCVECGKNFKDSHMTIEIELEDTIIPALGHDYIHHAKVDATCVNDGLDEHYTCSRCGKVFDLNKVETNLEDLVISALGHNYIAVVTNPTCEADGYTTYTCSICGDSYVSDLVNALGHDYEISYIWNSDNSKVFAYALCNTCGDSIYEEAIVVSTIKNPTCKQEGLVTYKAEFTNSIFDTQIKEEVLDKLSHTEGDAVIENLVSSTCSEEGSYDSVVYCTVCHEELHRHNITVDKVDHSYTSVVTNPTCDSQGFTTYTCERCGDSYVSDFVDALGHSYTSVVTDPTCEVQGYTTYTCERCGHSFVADLVAALGHDYEITYTWNGNSKVTATAVCKHNNLHIITETVTTSSKTIDATCDEAGKITYLATFSNPLFESQSKEVVINALGHNLVFHEEVTPTCEETGLLAYYTCSRCGKVFDLNMDEVNLSDLVIPALGHNTISFITEPTCDTQGYTTYICDRCGETYVSDYTDALGHSYTAVVTNPTCENQGYTTYTCDRCGHSYVSDYTDALGHTYQISYEWSSDNSKVIAKALCLVCGDEITEEASTSYTLILDPTCTNEGLGKYIVNFTNSLFSSLEKEIILDSLGHDLVFHDELLPTCENPGHNAYHTCSRCDYSTFEKINALGHNASSAVEENRIEATCDTAGSYDLVVYCSVCGEELSRTKMTILATGHSYTSIVTLPTCETEGYTTHTCSICNHIYIDNHISALGHSYGEVVYEWSDDYLTITATKTCLRCGKVVKEVSDTLVTIVKDATCTDTGIQCYTSNFKLFDNLSKNIVIPKINHTYGDLVEENRIEATCEVDGSYDSVIYCTVCGEELSREPHTIPALGHDFDYANGVWSWNNYDSAKYIIYCKHNHSEKEIYTAEIESTLTKAPTDLETGLRVYTAKVIILGITYTDSLTEVIPTTDHTITIVYGVLPTCENSGNITYYYCESCDKYYSDAELKNEITYEETILAPLGHDYISHKAKAATCTEAGYDAYQTCSRCDYSTYHEIPALGHNFITQVIAPTCTESGYTLHTCSNCNESFIDTYESALGHDYQITYTWESDYSSITAKAICHHDDSHIIIEVVNTKSSTITLATCDSDGSIKYSAVFENALFEAQAKIIKVAKLGHKEGEAAIENVVAATCTTDGSHDLVYYCTVCSEELNRISVLDPALGHSLVHHDGVDATCKESGYYDYDICSVCGYSTYKEIPALGHKELEVVKVVIEEATCLGTGAHYDVTYCTVCHEELNRVIVIDEKLGHNYIDETIMATCTTPGYTAHTCSRCGKYYEDNNILPLGHDYSNIEYEWNSDNTYCVAYAYCSHDHNHVIKEETYSSYVIMSNSTCEEDGLKIYTANFTNIRFEDQNKNVVIPALGHSYLEAEYTWNEYNSIVTASRLCEVCNHIDTLVSHTTSQTIAETCEEDGLIIYTAVFNDPAYEAQTKEVVIPHHGHLYGDVVYEWNNDYSKCHAIRVCQYDDNHIDEEISTSTNIKVLPTCLNDGLITYNAKFESREFETQVQKVVIPALGHDYCYHDIVLATCEMDGIDSYYTCNRCGEIFDKNKNTATMDDFILEAFGHLYGDVTYTWSSDYLSCKAVRVCSHDQNHIEEEVSYSSYVTVDPTCTNTGLVTYTVVFENKAFDTIIKKVVIPALGHSNSDIVIENHMDATCEVDGSYDSVIYCSVCGEELSRIHSIIHAFGHSYGDVSYTWSNDYKSVVAIRVCSHDESHIEEEVSYTTSKVKVAPTCEATGVMTYTAKFTNPAFATQVFNVSMNALGHDYDSWYLVDLPTKSETGLICRVCKNDSNHKEYYEVPKLNDIDYAYSILTEATGAIDGNAEYYQVFNGVEVRVEEVIPAYGFYYSYYKNNMLVATYHGYDGDSLEVPSDLDSYVVNGYVYYFNGWDKEIPSELHEDMKFYAKFIIAAVIYNDAVIEIPENLTIDTSYRILVEKETNENTINSRIERLTNIDDYSDFDLQSAFRIVFEKDGKTVSLADDVSITIKIKADRIDNLDSSTKLFYFNEDGKVQELNYRIENGYVIFEMGTVGAIGFANDGFNWLWAVFVIQSMSIVMLVVVIVYRKKVKA